ncbi:hypothetical protein M405DRAFT_834758 [Rhizopogon salebrosus TDB-379]|nr:hypothetical protein M405DRAFT_834758 [Rhizopogon salebrosus TDB-379]
MFCNIDKTIDIGMLLKQHELADGSEDEDDVIRSSQSYPRKLGTGTNRTSSTYLSSHQV